GAMMEPARLPIACDLSVLTDQERRDLEALANQIFPRADRAVDLPDGYALGFSDARADLLADVAAFIALDRLCCAFLRHALVVDAGPGVAWLELTGGPGAKEAIASDLRDLLSYDLTSAPARLG
ncbi:MAG TPA: hypothetical protein VK891_16495, partial [Euzebyales bacterium]|nr:hypothetical protein [Euzebyales bacterium]